ncbi:hypothetical protein [Cryobacterium cryoconiti]|uniref:Uncharacterized protein n=1 Tax=Cryobacterium cryoconiti TaxID=1259239 RepID=A0A4Y8JRE9_9MICO|nr:hypothetical protein [Cryobacterium cryoconiti]TFD27482.1 hypothetical protein E3T49_13135 [Cryobacterium cryoconiti]
MSTLDLYSDDFPHGTPDGFEQGCRGSACPNQTTDAMTCRKAHMRYQGDYQYRKAIDAGQVWVEPAPEKKVKDRRTDADAAHTALRAAREVAQVDVVPVAPKPAPPAGPATDWATLPKKRKNAALTVNDPMFPHGTSAGAKACTDEAKCPGTPTCQEARRQYQRDYRAAAKADATAATASAAVAFIKDEPVLTVPEPMPVALSAAIPVSPAAPAEDWEALAGKLLRLVDELTDSSTGSAESLRVAEAAKSSLIAENQRLQDELAQAFMTRDVLEARQPLRTVLANQNVTVNPSGAGGVAISVAEGSPPMFIDVQVDSSGLTDVRVTTGIMPGLGVAA